MFCFVSVNDELRRKHSCSNSRQVVFYWLVVKYRPLSVCFDWTFAAANTSSAKSTLPTWSRPNLILPQAVCWYFSNYSRYSSDSKLRRQAKLPLTCNCSAVVTFSRYIHILLFIPSENNLLDLSSTSRSIGGCSSFPNTGVFQAMLSHLWFLSCFFSLCFVLFFIIIGPSIDSSVSNCTSFLSRLCIFLFVFVSNFVCLFFLYSSIISLPFIICSECSSPV